VTVTLSALSVGPAASAALSAREATVRLHSVFPSTVNLAVERAAVLVAMTGPLGTCYPHAVALERAVDFKSLFFAAGDCGRIHADEIHLRGQGGDLVVTLGQARRLQARALPEITFLGNAWGVSARRLNDFQCRSSCGLRLGALFTDAPFTESLFVDFGAPTPFAAAVQRSARALGRAAVAGGELGTGLSQAVSSLVGAGAGLTPAGDDFLSGFMAASRASGSPALVSALGEAVTVNLAATGEISASLLRCAIEGSWPTPLADLADALSVDNGPAALRAVEELCRMGHSSGADVATGFLFGVACLLREPA